MCTLHNFFRSKVRFIHTCTGARSHSFSEKKYAYASRTSFLKCYYNYHEHSIVYQNTASNMMQCYLIQLHHLLIRRVYAECSPLFQLIELINTLKADKNDTLLEKN